MALEGAEWGAVAGVFVIIFAMVVYNQMVAKRNTAATQSSDGSASSGENAGEYLSRFVVHEGDVVGEVVALEGDTLIVKHRGDFRAVPIATTKVANDEVHVRGELDWQAASEQGRAWLEKNRKGQHDDVSADLTTSADVQRPAFEAFQSRQKEIAGDSEEE